MLSDFLGSSQILPVFRPKRPKTLPFGAAHTYMAYITEYPLGSMILGYVIVLV